MGHVWSRLHNRQITLSALSSFVADLVTQVCFYTRYTCVLVGRPKYVQWISPRYLRQSQLASRATGDPSSPYSPSLLLSTLHIFIFELWVHCHPPFLCAFSEMCLTFRFKQHFNGNKTSVFSSHIHCIHETLALLRLPCCILGTVVVEFSLCPPAWRRKSIVKTAVCLFVNKLMVWPGIINPSTAGLQALRRPCPTTSLFLGLVYSPLLCHFASLLL